MSDIQASTDVSVSMALNGLKELFWSAGEFVVGADYEARLSKTLLPRVKAAQLQRLADACCIDQSCVIKAIAHKKCAGTYLSPLPPTPPRFMYTSMHARELKTDYNIRIRIYSFNVCCKTLFHLSSAFERGNEF